MKACSTSTTAMSRHSLLALALTALVCLANVQGNGAQARMIQQSHAKRDSRLLQHGALAERQLLGGPGDPGTQQQPASNAAPVASGAASTASTPADDEAESAPAAQPSASSPLLSILNPVTGGLSTVSSSTLARASTAVSSSSSLSSVVSSLSESEDESTTARTRAATPSVVNVYSTALIQPSDSASSSSAVASSAAQKDDDDNGGGGINKMTMIIIIAVASSVGLIAAAWTIFRKWKLSPSRQFDDRLNPIAWTSDMPNPNNSDDKIGLTRSNSDGSGVSSLYKNGSAMGGPTPLANGGHLRRNGSWGSAHGSAFGSRNDMLEVGYGQPAMQPAYPPANPYGAAPSPYADNYGYQQRMPSPYEQVQRQPTFNGGRYGEGYGSAAGSIRR